jgi:hypothetical protein
MIAVIQGNFLSRGLPNKKYECQTMARELQQYDTRKQSSDTEDIFRYPYISALETFTF